MSGPRRKAFAGERASTESNSSVGTPIQPDNWAKTLEGRETFQFLADRWKELAADIERAEASLEKLNEKGFRGSLTYPYD